MLKGHFSSLIPECIAAIVILQTYIIYLNPIYDYVLGPVAYSRVSNKQGEANSSP